VESINVIQKLVRVRFVVFAFVISKFVYPLVQYRGHLGRKAAKRWALKRAEIGALHALLNSAAIFIQARAVESFILSKINFRMLNVIHLLQRIWRGYLARIEAIQTRAQMAQFIALMRAQEATEDEEQYWDTHPWSRLKKNMRSYADKTLMGEANYKVMGK